MHEAVKGRFSTPTIKVLPNLLNEKIENEDFRKMKYNQGMQKLSDTASTHDKNAPFALHGKWYDFLKNKYLQFLFHCI